MVTNGHATEFHYYIDKPAVTIGCPHVVNEAKTLVLNCKVTEAEPAVDPKAILWYYNGSMTRYTGEKLEMSNITREQKGNYSCVASNQVGTSQMADCPIDVYCE